MSIKLSEHREALMAIREQRENMHRDSIMYKQSAELKKASEGLSLALAETQTIITTKIRDIMYPCK